MSFRRITPARHDVQHDLLRKIGESLAVGLGQYGRDRVNAEDGQQTGEWLIMHAILESTVAFIRNGTSESITLAAGDRIYGQITQVTVSGGDIELYRSPQ